MVSWLATEMWLVDWLRIILFSLIKKKLIPIQKDIALVMLTNEFHPVKDCALKFFVGSANRFNF